MKYHLDHLPEVQAAIKAADACDTLGELTAAIHAFDAHPATRSTPMPGRRGERCTQPNPVMLLGKSPAWTENATRIPFSGPAGQCLRRAFDQVGFDMERFHISCATPWMARKNTPNATQLAFSRPFLMREIALVRPSVILALGQKAHEALFQKAEPLGDKPGSEVGLAVQGEEHAVRILFCHAYIFYNEAARMPGFTAHLQEAANDHPEAFQHVTKAA